MSGKKTSRRTFLKASALGAAAAVARPAWAAPAVARQRPPNLFFVHVDQLTLSALPQFGCRHVETPNLDRLASRGTSFQLSHSADPICCPARACWFTGRASIENGVVLNSDGRMPLRPEIPDLGAWLRNAGYDTFYVGKWHVTGREVNDSFHVFHEHCNLGEQNDAPIARTCETFLSQRPAGGSPFFLVAGLLNPHDVCAWTPHWSAGEPLPYPAVESQLPPLAPNHDQFDPREPETLKALVRPRNPHDAGWTEQIWRYYLWSYYRQVEMVDAALGRILDALEDSPHADNTLLVFTADHGDAIGAHRLQGKNTLYDNSVCVPLVVSYPGRVAPHRVDGTHLASGLDLAPTLCDYAGVAPPPDQRGRSLRPVLEERNDPWREYVVAHSAAIGRMVRSQRYKYVAYQGDPTDQLFDLVDDPWEMKNLSGEAAAAGPLADHRRMLAEWEARLKPIAEPAGGWRSLLTPGALRRKTPLPKGKRA